MTLPTLSLSDFPDVFAAIHGHAPFPWQMRLVESLTVKDSAWPTVLALPTGAGKTAALDAALFHLALQAEASEERRAPVRIAFVVDRRIIVDEAFDRAERIAAALMAAKRHSPLGRMASRLCHLSADGPPLAVAKLRGGIPRENDWARAPNQPTILCSTVDQVGSRLLFRGYGVSDSMKPVHAGLLGSDCLFLLDEAHLAAPFFKTLQRVGAYRAPPWCGHQPGPWQVVTLSATSQATGKRFDLGEEDRINPVLAQRLEARKLAILRLIGKPAKKQEDETAETGAALQVRAFVKAAKDLLEADQIRKLAVVVNRVALARAIFVRLREEFAELDETACILLTGRIRDWDRDQLRQTYFARLKSGAAHEDGAGHLIVVATQTIEAGADFDFDAMVTQIAPLDSLRQRFGRLNRLGNQPEAPAIILAAADEVAKRADDSIYGTRAKQTWDWLQAVAEQPAQGKKKVEPRLDFGISAMDVHLKGLGDDLTGLVCEQPQAPFLRPADVMLLSWTAPVPAVDPELSLFLHGPKSGPADVQIVWRTDITAETLRYAAGILELVPPHSGETLAVPLWSARAWLSRSEDADDISDVEGAPEPAGRMAEGRQAFRWAGPESERTGLIRPSALRPGDVIVVPSAYGGCDAFGWNPVSRENVVDVGDERSSAGRRWLKRVHPALLGPEVWERVESAAWKDTDLTERERVDALRDAGLDLPVPTCKVFWPYRDKNGESADGMVLVSFTQKAEKKQHAAITEDDESGSLSGLGLSLAQHGEDVSKKARSYARALGLSGVCIDDLALAAWFHDQGKADPRFQTWLRGVDRLAAALRVGQPLAKSLRPMTRAESRTARSRAGLPNPWRHEVRSVTEAIGDPEFARAHDPELVLWLIGTHHGHGRPLFPHYDPSESDDKKGPHQLDFDFHGHDWPQLFERLTARYGPWELARLEAILRLADHRASEEAEP